MNDNEYIYEIIDNENDSKSCAQLIAEEFLRVRSTDEIVGAVIAGDLYLQYKKKKQLSNNQSNILYHKIPVEDLIDELNELFISRDFGQELKLNTVLHIILCAVHNQHSRYGIASQFRQKISDYARNQRRFQYLLVQATHPATRHIYVNKINGKEVTIIDPTTWIWKKYSDELVYPYKDYKGGLIPNILVKL